MDIPLAKRSYELIYSIELTKIMHDLNQIHCLNSLYACLVF